GPGPGPTVWAGTVAYLPPSGPEGYDPATLDGLADPHPARPAPLPGQRVRAGDLRLFWSLSFAMTTADFAALGGFDEAYVGYGGEDTDFAMRLRAAGGSLWWLGGAAAYHQHHPTQNPPVQHRSDIVRNANLFAQRWGWHPMEGWLAGFADAGLARLDPASGCWMLTEPEEA
ncbi:MAG: galactosyltransferase-related protein, partial [Micrococcales bacterium]|nr:galactosyltransferase-related protein [Micrococcales bacterium]